MTLQFRVDWEDLETGPAAERACAAAFEIRVNDETLTQVEDTREDRVRSTIHVSAYPVAEWFAWNWWRLRWEPKRNAVDWSLAHSMASVGGGYVWPDITFASDGERVHIEAKQTPRQRGEPIRYLTGLNAVLPASAFEQAVDRFEGRVLERLREKGIQDSDLQSIWSDVTSERADPEAARYRRFEAILGYDPDAADQALVGRLIAESEAFGESGLREIAALSSVADSIPSVKDLQDTARRVGIEEKLSDVVRLGTVEQLSPTGSVPAWRRGVAAANALRQQERLGDEPVENRRLAEMLGMSASVIDEARGTYDFSYAIDDEAETGHVVLRSKRETGRRFDLARILGDRIANQEDARLFPATHTYTYRQKLQRAFAAEFLCPLAKVEEMLDGDYSEESQIEVADFFEVSPLTVRMLLVNNGRISRDDAQDFDVAAAA